MAEEKHTEKEEIITEPQLHADDIDMLRYVLEHVRGATPSSLSAPVFADEE